jgi:pterin-4a-carbinolamine dehydratase
MYQSALHFLTPHPLFNEVQNAPRTLLESPQSAVAQAGEQLSKWSVDFDGKGDCLKATFEFTSHADAVQKITWLHDAQEICDHHTSFTLKDFSAIDITLVTHEPRWGVTSKDICMAKLIQCYFTKGQLSE